MTTVQAAWSQVMDEVRSLAKKQKHDTPGAKFMFRGVDAVMNAVGPALRVHEVMVVPTTVVREHRDVQTSTGKPSRETTVTVTYTIYGPGGDSMIGQSAGEAMDGGDKGTAKAMSVAYRVFLLQALCLPTDEPDPDEFGYERQAQPSREQRQAEVRDLLGKAQTPGQARQAGSQGHYWGVLDDQLNAEIRARVEELEQQAQAKIDNAVGGAQQAEQLLADQLGATPVEGS